MSQWQRVIAIIAVVGIAAWAWLGRYELVGAGEGFGVYRLDRWTGTVWIFTANWAKEVRPDAAPPQ